MGEINGIDPLIPPPPPPPLQSSFQVISTISRLQLDFFFNHIRLGSTHVITEIIIRHSKNAALKITAVDEVMIAALLLSVYSKLIDVLIKRMKTKSEGKRFSFIFH